MCGARIALTRAQQKDPAVWAAFLAGWEARYGSRPVPAHELHSLPEAAAVHPDLTVFGRRLGAAWRSGAVVDGRRVVQAQQIGRIRRGGRVIRQPATWALEEAP
jgi:hypothetical protein